MPLPLTIALGGYDRTRPLIDGRVTVEGCAATIFELEPEEMFLRALHFAEFDVAELSLSNFLTMTAAGTCPYIGLPVFPARRFRHSGIFINRRSGIARPEDLKGKCVGTPEYPVTAVTWVRGILADDHKVAPSDMRWRWGGLRQPGRGQKAEFSLPPGVELEPIPETTTLQDMLAEGTLDALISPRAPAGFLNGHPDIARLFPDYMEREKAYFRRTGIFPIMHVMGLRTTLHQQQPWLASSLVKAFEAAKALAIDEVAEDNIPRITNPWMEAHDAETRALMGEDFWPYGIGPNRHGLETFLRYHHDQGLAARRLTVEELFAPSTLSASRI